MNPEEQLFNVLLNYGIAGIILFVFYKLMSNELRELRNSINEMTRKLERLITLLEKSRS